MRDDNRISSDRLDLLGRRLLRAADVEPAGERGSEASFLAGFRRKLEAERRRRHNVVSDIGGLGWRLGPMLAPAMAALALALLFSQPAPTEAADEPAGTQLWSAVSEGAASEISGPAVLDAILLSRRR